MLSSSLSKRGRLMAGCSKTLVEVVEVEVEVETVGWPIESTSIALFLGWFCGDMYSNSSCRSQARDGGLATVAA